LPSPVLSGPVPVWHRRVVQPICASGPNPKFVMLFSPRRTNFGFEKDTSKFMI
jgi:hypothetical protein